MEKYGFVYIWRDRKHKRFYVGCHWGDEHDGYVCSSPWMLKAYARRKNDFRRRILVRTASRVDTYLEEQRWLNLIKPHEIRTKYYNLNLHVTDYWHQYEDKRLTIAEKISCTAKNNYQNPDYMKKYMKNRDAVRKPHSEETKAKRIMSIKKTLAVKFPVDQRRKRVKHGSPEHSVLMSANKRWNKEVRI
jgi:hypothetical protein